MSLQQQLQDAVDGLGAEYDDWLRNLRASGCRGRPKRPRDCILARYFQSKVVVPEGLILFVAGGVAAIYPADPHDNEGVHYTSVPLPPHGQKLLTEFDVGQHRDLCV